MTMSTQVLAFYQCALQPEFKNIHTIRIGTKALSYWPYRFTEDEELLELLKSR